jgi:hypothetical protein
MLHILRIILKGLYKEEERQRIEEIIQPRRSLDITAGVLLF